MSHKIAISTLTALLLLAASCGTPSSAPSASVSPAASVSASPELSRWGETLIQKTYEADDKTEILKISYSLPKRNNPDLAGLAINAYYEHKEEELVAAAEEELLQDASDAYDSSQGDTFMSYEDSQTYTIAFEDSSYISFLRERYLSTSAPHPNTEIASETFRLDSGKKMDLSDFFRVPQEEYETVIIQELVSQANEKTDILYENYQSVIQNDFDPDQFYLGQTGFVFYFQPYEIAPYAAGTITFEVPYTTLKDMMEEWN
jgi:hypothetical protein